MMSENIESILEYNDRVVEYTVRVLPSQYLCYEILIEWQGKFLVSMFSESQINQDNLTWNQRVRKVLDTDKDFFEQPS